MKPLVVACVHGNEPYGLEGGRRLPPFFSFLVANPGAVEKNARFVDADLNRVFPGNAQGNQEERIAAALAQRLKGKFVVDLHSTSEPCPLFGIITKPCMLAAARRLGLQKVVFMTPAFAKGKALIDHCKGISLEVGPHDRKENAGEALACFDHYLEGKKSNPELFKVVGIVRGRGTPLIQNFVPVRKGECIAKDPDVYADKDFVPFLVGEKSYSDVLCLQAVATTSFG